MLKVRITYTSTSSIASVCRNDFDYIECVSMNHLPNGLVLLQLSNGTAKYIPVNRILEMTAEMIEGDMNGSD